MRTLIEKSVCFNIKKDAFIENANFELLKGKNVSFKYKYLEEEVENQDIITILIPNEENSAIKDFIIWKINAKLSEFVEEKSDIFVSELQQDTTTIVSEEENSIIEAELTEQEKIENYKKDNPEVTDFDATMFFIKL